MAWLPSGLRSAGAPPPQRRKARRDNVNRGRRAPAAGRPNSSQGRGIRTIAAEYPPIHAQAGEAIWQQADRVTRTPRSAGPAKNLFGATLSAEPAAGSRKHGGPGEPHRDQSQAGAACHLYRAHQTEAVISMSPHRLRGCSGQQWRHSPRFRRCDAVMESRSPSAGARRGVRRRTHARSAGARQLDNWNASARDQITTGPPQVFVAVQHAREYAMRRLGSTCRARHTGIQFRSGGGAGSVPAPQCFHVVGFSLAGRALHFGASFLGTGFAPRLGEGRPCSGRGGLPRDHPRCDDGGQKQWRQKSSRETPPASS